MTTNEIPMPLVELFADLMDQASRAVSGVESARQRGDTARYYMLGSALRAIQHRIEGVQLCWYALSGGRDESDHELHAAAQEWWIAHPR